MKPYFYLALLTATGIFGNCKKQVSKPAGFTENKIVAVNTCSPFVQNGVNYSICLDSVTSESRCPAGAKCIWAGYAKARFTFTAGAAVHHFYLHTGAVTNKGGLLPQDTLINNIKIQFINLAPYPDMHAIVNYNNYKAEMVIKQL